MRSDDGITEGSCGQVMVLLRVNAACDGITEGSCGQTMVLLRVVAVRRWCY